MLYRAAYRVWFLASLLVLSGWLSACDNPAPPADQINAPTTGAPPEQASSVAAPATGTAVLDAAVAVDARAASDDEEDAGVVRVDAAMSSTTPAAGTGAAGAGAAASAGAPSTMQPVCASDLDASHLPKRLPVTGALQLSDPAVIQAEGTFYAFGTGPGLPIRTSKDLLTWRDAGRVFTSNPSWIERLLPAASELWSPDVSFFGGVYHLYYAASKQGGNRSCIGHATAESLPGPFRDRGEVLCSNLAAQEDDWNAIHPSFIEDTDGTPYLAFGSFYSGLKLIALDPATGKPLDRTPIAIAVRMREGDAIEAPFIVRRCDYFYLFASFDRCCDGVNSTYKIFVGRSRKLTGPYVDRDGKPMLQGGGTQVVIGDETWHGPGHSAVFKSDERWYEAHHAYYAGEPSAILATGQAYLRISELMWDADGWPASGGP